MVRVRVRLSVLVLWLALGACAGHEARPAVEPRATDAELAQLDAIKEQRKARECTDAVRSERSERALRFLHGEIPPDFVFLSNPSPDRQIGIVKAAIEGCDDCCTGPALAEMWVLLGTIRLAELNDETAARQAFRKAVEYDRTIQPPETYTTTRSLQMLEEIRASSR
jgi:hypothetical protein